MNHLKRLCRGWVFLILILAFAGCAGTKTNQVRQEEMKKEPASQTLEAQPEAIPEKKSVSASRPEPKAFPPPRGNRIRSENLPPLPAYPQAEKTASFPVPRGVALPSPAVSPSGAVTPGDPTTKGSRFVLNFDNADIYEVIRVMAEMMKLNYIIDPRVRGVVNIHTSGQISSEEVFPIFQSILKLNGATVVQRGLIHEIVPFGDAKKLYMPPVSSRDGGRKLEGERYVIQIIPLKYIPVSEVAKMVKPFLSDGADIVEQPSHNILIVGDISSNVKKSLDMIDLFDVDIFADMRVRIYPVVNADVNEIAKEMERIFSSLEVSLKSGRGVGITFTPVVRINSLLVVSSIPRIFEKVEAWLKELDRIPGEGTQLSVFVYHVQNGKAKDVADVLKQIYTSTKGARGDFREKVLAPAPAAAAAPGARGVRPTPAPVKSEGPSEAGGVPEGEISIVVDEATNALIIRAYHRDYKAILETIKKLDIYPKQVLIEVLLAEVTLTDAYQYGLEFSTFMDSFTKDGSVWNYTLGMGGTAPGTITSGVRYTLESAGRMFAAIHASAQDNRLKVISSPQLLASNNKEARIQIGSSQPILTNTYTTTGTAAPGVVEGTIEYKDIGIILTVTPRISDGKLVTMDVSVEASTVGQTTLGNLSSVPFFGKKTAKTTLSIMEGQAIVIGGLIEHRKVTTKEGVPFLSKIPVLGSLFGYDTNEVNKTETVLFLTPHVISDLEESNRVTQEVREKMIGIRKELERQKMDYEKQRKKDSPGREQEAKPKGGPGNDSPGPATVASNRDPWLSDVPP